MPCPGNGALNQMSGHWATLLAALPTAPLPTFTWERLTLPDGDFCDLAFPSFRQRADPSKENLVTLWLLPGLSSRAGDASYLNRFLGLQGDRPWQPIIWHGRGQSGVPNRHCRFWSAVDYQDFCYSVQVFQARFPARAVLAVGFSMGALVLLHALAALGSGAITRAAALSAPLQPAAVAKRLDQGFSKLYQTYLLRKLEKQLQAKFPQTKILRHKNFFELDALWTAPLQGFQTVDAYYQASDITKKIVDISTPTLLLQARNDPFFPKSFSAFPASPWLTLENTSQGGHLGFRRQAWQKIWDFLELFQSDITRLE